ncbi:MAG: hypothetical protein WCC08_06005, partial [Terrimicrobiaceae bacterium]
GVGRVPLWLDAQGSFARTVHEHFGFRDGISQSMIEGFEGSLWTRRIRWDASCGKEFDKITDAFDQVLEIMHWIHDNVEYVPGTTTSSTSAYDMGSHSARVLPRLRTLSHAHDSHPSFRWMRLSPRSDELSRVLGGLHPQVLGAIRVCAPPNGLPEGYFHALTAHELSETADSLDASSCLDMSVSVNTAPIESLNSPEVA